MAGLRPDRPRPSADPAAGIKGNCAAPVRDAERNGLKNSSRLRVAGALAAVVGVSVVGVGGASADSQSKGPVPTIEIKGGKFKNLRFEGPDTVDVGAMLQIENKTNAEKVGPHSFSLVEKDALPANKKQRKKCENLEFQLCEDVATAHEVEFGPGGPVVNQPNAENGTPGWDLTFDGDGRLGDSWFTQNEDETTSRPVSAGPSTLRYFCVVHPKMKGKLTVVDAP
jgi:hypothetical protein